MKIKYDWNKKKLQDSEIKVMNVIWREEPVTAKRIAEVLKEEIGWNVNTTYTLINRCIAKGVVERSDPHFTCRSLIAKEDIQSEETERLINKIFDGSVDKLFASLLGHKQLSKEKIEELKDIIDKLE